ncbi:Leucyl/phenylalanyl-tRNA-protein transferase [Propionibacterium freudenreichii]|uniref:leucyl/phenylalanyl-tRNA--protein transferase n=1 Tax=Propionibacterium freudenreichii TaxID=1744 RepID=UPI00054230D8|nr:leucyl/phenylalanyl-tRNA--protein transferase [Propionibacterium freudenreichii]CEH09054.1 Leucyl/phenylalanyl-tRNA-protein transferase [Propionibacterium freudenreichii]
MLAHVFGPEASWPSQDLVGFTEQIDAGLTMAAYASGLFPMPLHESEFHGMGWWSPMQRGIIPLPSLRVSHSLRQALRRYRTTIDTSFDEVLAGCADPTRPGSWIDDDVKAIYTGLFERGVVHSVETWDDDDRLVGGLYGVGLRGLFAGESMFHDREHGRDASKVALVRLVDTLSARPDGKALLDTQWLTPHLASLGGVEIPRHRYLELLDDALDAPETAWPAPGVFTRGRALPPALGGSHA